METRVRLVVVHQNQLIPWALYTVEVMLVSRVCPQGHGRNSQGWSDPRQAVIRTPSFAPMRWVNHWSLCGALYKD